MNASVEQAGTKGSQVNLSVGGCLEPLPFKISTGPQVLLFISPTHQPTSYHLRTPPAIALYGSMATTRQNNSNGAPASKARYPLTTLLTSEIDTNLQQKSKTPRKHPARKSTSHNESKFAKMAYAPPRVSGSRVAKATKKQPPPASDMLRRITRSMTNTSRKAVFNTTELLENIISFLPPLDIVAKAQRVSSEWKDFIASLPIIQTLLWRPRFTRVLGPSSNSHDIEALRDNSTPGCRSYWTLPGKIPLIDLAIGMPMYSEAVEFQDLFFEKSGGLTMVKTAPNAIGNLKTAHFKFNDYDINIASHGARPTWFDVHITSPPIQVAQMCVWVRPKFIMSRDDWPGKWVHATLYDRHGITFGTAAEVLNKVMNSRPQRWTGGWPWASIGFVTDAKGP